MPYGLYISAEGANAQSQRLNVLANNLANVDTNGFKRDIATFQARFAEAAERGLALPGDCSINDIGGGIELFGTMTDFSTGPLKSTGQDLDFAIKGDAFFQVLHDGKPMLTRAGNFQLDPSGALVTQDGDAVLDDAGSPVVIDPDNGPWVLSPDGCINQGGDAIPIGLVRPRSLGDLVKVGENLFRPLAPVTQLDPEERHVMQGFVEGSTVKPTIEMMELIETSRAFEANTNMIRHQDQVMGQLISRVLKDN